MRESISIPVSSLTAVDSFTMAAHLLRETKHTGSDLSRQEQLLEIGPLLREVCFHLDRLAALPMPALEAFRDAAGLRDGVLGLMPTSTELVLTCAVQDMADTA